MEVTASKKVVVVKIPKTDFVLPDGEWNIETVNYQSVQSGADADNVFVTFTQDM